MLSSANPFVFLIDTLAGLYIGAVMVRFLLQMVRADFYNPISQFLVKITNPVLIPTRRFVPSVGSVDTASLVVLFVLQLATLFLLTLISGAPIPPFTLVLYAIVSLISLAFSVFIFSLIIQAILSWVQTGQQNPVTTLLHNLNEPILSRVRKYIPPMSGIDLSVMAAIIGLLFVKQSIGWFIFQLFGIH